jgi:hypothetical protein
MTGMSVTSDRLSRREAIPSRLFTFRSGGWILLAGFVFAGAGVWWNLRILWDPERVPPRGDGRNAASYGFSLDHATVPPAEIVSSGMVVDGLRALVNPEVTTPPEVVAFNERERGKYLVSSDKVIGIVLGGEARAYPLRVMNWHEVANDVVGGVPVAVTYHPLSEGIVVFDRRVGDAVLEFGVSGLLHDSNLLMFDRRPGSEGESLWSQIQARAVAGPAAGRGERLEVLPVALARWDDWVRDHPDTTVLAPIREELEFYKRDLYGKYWISEEIKYPVSPAVPEDSLPPKTRVFVDLEGPTPVVTPLASARDDRKLEQVGPFGTTPRRGIFAFWFAWYGGAK